MLPPSPHPTSTDPPVDLVPAADEVRTSPDRPHPNRLVARARNAAATDAATAAAGSDDGQQATDHLHRLLSTVPVIEQARGLLMGFYGIDPNAAFDLLVRWSQTTNTKLVGISEALVTAASTTRSAGEPFAGLRSYLASLGPALNRVGPESTSDRNELSARRRRSTGRSGSAHASAEGSSDSPSSLFSTSNAVDVQQEASASG